VFAAGRLRRALRPSTPSAPCGYDRRLTQLRSLAVVPLVHRSLMADPCHCPTLPELVLDTNSLIIGSMNPLESRSRVCIGRRSIHWRLVAGRDPKFLLRITRDSQDILNPILMRGPGSRPPRRLPFILRPSGGRCPKARTRTRPSPFLRPGCLFEGMFVGSLGLSRGDSGTYLQAWAYYENQDVWLVMESRNHGRSDEN